MSKKRRVSPISLANLRPWQPGCPSPNPYGGRPPRFSIRAALLARLAMDSERTGRTEAECLADRLVEAASGKSKMGPYQLEPLRFIVEQVDGKRGQPVGGKVAKAMDAVRQMSDMELREKRRALARDMRAPALPDAGQPISPPFPEAPVPVPAAPATEEPPE